MVYNKNFNRNDYNAIKQKGYLETKRELKDSIPFDGDDDPYSLFDGYCGSYFLEEMDALTDRSEKRGERLAYISGKRKAMSEFFPTLSKTLDNHYPNSMY